MTLIDWDYDLLDELGKGIAKSTKSQLHAVFGVPQTRQSLTYAQFASGMEKFAKGLKRGNAVLPDAHCERMWDFICHHAVKGDHITLDEVYMAFVIRDRVFLSRARTTYEVSVSKLGLNPRRFSFIVDKAPAVVHPSPTRQVAPAFPSSAVRPPPAASPGSMPTSMHTTANATPDSGSPNRVASREDVTTASPTPNGRALST